MGETIIVEGAAADGTPSIRRGPIRRRNALALVAALAILVGALLGGVGVARALPGAATPGDDSAEAGFARDMSTHHRQAVEMAFLILDRTDDPAIRLLATDIITTQQHQIGQMYAWLALWDVPQAGFEEPMAWMGHPAGDRMPGLASPEALRRLADLRGVEAVREFLRLMIEHHRGGVPMAEAVIDRSDQEVVTRLAHAIIDTQSAEIETMEAMLAAKGGSLTDDSAPVASTAGDAATPPTS